MSTPSDRDYPATEAAPRCEEHGGAHARYLGRCLAVGAQVPRPFTFHAGRCETCLAALDVRRDNRDGSVVRLEAGTDRPHVHAEPIAVALEPEQLAGALADAFEEVRQRRERRRPQPSSEETTPSPPERPAVGPGAALGGIPRLGQ